MEKEIGVLRKAAGVENFEGTAVYRKQKGWSNKARAFSEGSTLVSTNFVRHGIQTGGQ